MMHRHFDPFGINPDNNPIRLFRIGHAELICKLFHIFSLTAARSARSFLIMFPMFTIIEMHSKISTVTSAHK